MADAEKPDIKLAELPAVDPKRDEQMTASSGSTTSSPAVQTTTPQPSAEISLPTDKTAEVKSAEITASPDAARRSEIFDRQRDEVLMLNEATREQIRTVIGDRQKFLEIARQKGLPLDQATTLVLKHGETLMQKLRAGTTLTNDEMITALFVFNDDVFQRTYGSGRTVELKEIEEETTTETPKHRFLIQKGIETVTTIDKKVIVGVDHAGIQVNTDYTEFLGLQDKPPEHIENMLSELFTAQRQLEIALDVPDIRSTTLSSMLERANLSRFDTFVVASLRKNLGETNFDQLYKENPTEAMEKMWQARRQALVELMGQNAKDLLEGELSRDDIHVEEIERNAKQAETGKAKTQEELQEAKQPLQDKLDDATAAYEEAKRARDGFKTRLEGVNGQDGARDIKIKKESELAALEKEYEGKQPLLAQRVDTAQDVYNNIKREFEEGKTQREGENTKDFNARRKYQQDKLSEAENRLNTIKGELETLEGNLRRTRQEAETAGKIVEQLNDDLKTAETNLVRKTTAKNNASERLKEKVKELETGDKDKAKAFRYWGYAATHIDSILTQPFVAGQKGEYSTSRLANIEEADGTLKGADKLRRLLFNVAGDIPLDPKITRQVLSDETLARAMIGTLGIDISDKTKGVGNLLQEVDNAGLALKSNTDESQSAILERKLKSAQLTLLKDVLPQLKRVTGMEVGQLLANIIREGTIGAQEGNPYLSFATSEMDMLKVHTPKHETHEKQIPEQGIPKIGEASITVDKDKNPTISYETDPDETTQEKITITIEGSKIDFSVEVKITPTFLATLPETLTEASAKGIILPHEIEKYFYDSAGNKRTYTWQEAVNEARTIQEEYREKGDAKPQELEWLELSADTITDKDAQLMGADRATSEIIENIRVISGITTTEKFQQAIANTVLRMKPEERIKLLSGMRQTQEALNIAEQPENIILDLSNTGELRIRRISSQREASEFMTIEQLLESIKQEIAGIDTPEEAEAMRLGTPLTPERAALAKKAELDKTKKQLYTTIGRATIRALQNA